MCAGVSAEAPAVLSVDTPFTRVLYAGDVVRNAVRSLWAEPRVPDPPTRVWRDWALVAVLVPLAVLEVILREDLVWRPVALVLGAAPVFTLLWRRTHPLVVVAVAFGAQTLADVTWPFGADESAVLYTTAYVLLLPYSLFRWGSGRDAAIGLAMILVGLSISDTGLDLVFAIGFFLFSAALGAAIRYQASSRLRDMDQVKLLEREQLARELHDTVAHHVSAIAIRAQAGRTLAAADPDAAVDALEVIEQEASRTLAEMRTMVGALRQGEEPDLAPPRGVADIERLAHGAGDRPRVDVELSGDLDDLPSSVEAGIYRLAQESITNALRHARHATRVNVLVVGDDRSVRLTVSDDGESGSFSAGSSSGYGIAGMTERAKLLGGTLEAGPSLDRGWTVEAMVPRNGTAI
jgi:signal transduction histidine kinase